MLQVNTENMICLAIDNFVSIKIDISKLLV